MYPNEFARLPSREKPSEMADFPCVPWHFYIQEPFSPKFFLGYPFLRFFSMTIVMGGNTLD
jgi:hypothetical protein